MGLYRNARIGKRLLNVEILCWEMQMKRLQIRFCLIVSLEISCSFLALEMQGCVSVCVL